MKTWIARILAVSIICAMCAGFVVVMPWAIELQKQQFFRRAAAAYGPDVPAASLPLTSPPPFNDTMQSANLNDGPGRGMKTAIGSGRLGFYEVNHE